VPDDFTALFEKQAGYLMVEDCVRAHANAATRAGATLQSGVEVRGWRVDGATVIVDTDQGALSADRLVVTAGAWANQLLYSLKVPFTVLRKPLFWYRSRNNSYLAKSGCPCFLFETMGGLFYGFPQLDEQGIKVAEHTGGDHVDNPLEVDRTLHPDDQSRVESFLRVHLPGVSKECTAHAVCMYTMSPDGHFVVGTHPEHPQVVFTAGLSGHGCKFTSVLGEIMADLALDGASRHPIDFRSPHRLASGCSQAHA
jgi:glycine/D-amino acid oxidase-like deaminating enzyme